MTRVASVICTGLFLGGSVAVAETTDGNAILEQSSKFAQSVKTVYCDTVSTMTSDKGPIATRMQAWAEAPDKMVTRFESLSGGGGFSSYRNGAQRTTFFPKKNQYISKQTTETNIMADLQETLAGPLGKEGPFGSKAGARQVTLIGKDTIGGISTNHVRITTGNGSSGDIWFADGAQPLPVYSTIQVTQPRMSGQSYSRWTVNQPIPAGTFRFTPPAGATDMMQRTQPNK